MLIAFSYLIPMMILSMMLLFALRLFFHNLRKLSLEEICRGVIYELTTISIWGGLGRKGSRGLQMGMATYYLLVNGQYIIWLYFNFYRSVELLYYSTNYNIYSRLQAGAFGRRVSFLAEGVKRDSEEAHLLKTVASGGPWHSEVQGEEALLTRLKDWAKSPPK